MNKLLSNIFNSRPALVLILLIVTLIAGQAIAKVDQPNLKHLYTVDNYGQDIRFVSPVAVFLDVSRQEVYICDSGSCRLIALKADTGQSLGYFQHRQRGQEANLEPVAVAVNSRGQVFVADSSTPRVYEYDYRGEPSGYFSMPQADPAYLPGKMAFDSTGNLYVSVRNQNKVVVFDQVGKLKTEIADPSSDGTPGFCDVSVGPDRSVFALSPSGTAVHLFDKQGHLIRQFGKHQPGRGSFSHPSAIDVDAKGRLWVADINCNTLKLFNPDGTFIAEYGGLGTQPGDFFSPADICIDRANQRLYVVEKTGQRLQAFSIEDK